MVDALIVLWALSNAGNAITADRKVIVPITQKVAPEDFGLHLKLPEDCEEVTK